MHSTKVHHLGGHVRLGELVFPVLPYSGPGSKRRAAPEKKAKRKRQREARRRNR